MCPRVASITISIRIYLLFFFFFKKQNLLHCSLKIHVCSRGGGGGGMGGVLGTFPCWKGNLALVSLICVCVCLYMYVYCEQPLCRCVRCISMLSSPGLSLSLSSYNCRRCWLGWRGGGRQTHFVVILIAASLKRTPQSTPWTWWDRPP